MYVITLDQNDDEVEDFYDAITKTVDILHKNEIL